MKIEKEQKEKLWKELLQRAYQYSNQEWGIEETEGIFYQTYSLETEQGRAFYETLEDEKLLEILQKRAEELRHSPTKKEVFWVLREYIRERFQKWPYALRAAGLSKAAGKGGKALSKQREEAEEYQMLLNEIRKKAKEICRIPHPRDLPQISIQVAKYADNWGKVILDAGIDEAFFQECAVYKIKNLETECVEDLSEIRQLSRQLHRAPLMGELPEDLKERVVKRCGSYRNALYQIGLEPVKKRNPFFSAKTGDTEQIEKKGHLTNLQNCYYQVVAPDIQTQKDLEQLYQYWKEHGEMPERKAVASELRKRLQQSCGSWANALYQIHYRETTGE